jgi:hypothetical protein
VTKRFNVRLILKNTENRKGRGEEVMQGLLIELVCPKYGLQRYTVKVIKRFNISPNEIMPKFRTKPKPGLSGIIIGRNVNEKEVRKFFENYLREKGLWERVLSLKAV